jgi:hypothetical protein
MGPGRAAGHEMCHQVPNASCCTVRLLKLQPLVERGLALSALPASVPRAGMKSALQYRLVYTLRNNRVALVVNVATADARRSQKLAIEVCNNISSGDRPHPSKLLTDSAKCFACFALFFYHGRVRFVPKILIGRAIQIEASGHIASAISPQ